MNLFFSWFGEGFDFSSLLKIRLALFGLFFENSYVGDFCQKAVWHRCSWKHCLPDLFSNEHITQNIFQIICHFDLLLFWCMIFYWQNNRELGCHKWPFFASFKNIWEENFACQCFSMVNDWFTIVSIVTVEFNTPATSKKSIFICITWRVSNLSRFSN